MEQENSKFKKVLDYLKENYNISEYKLGQILSEKVIGMSIDRSTINKYKNGKLERRVRTKFWTTIGLRKEPFYVFKRTKRYCTTDISSNRVCN